ncbi:MAG: Xre family transcriptional regulator, partial [Bacilli bacterium]|nr:Xre family transcriptional regulator [Bacilli bacterium]
DFGKFIEKLRGDLPLREAAERSGLSHTYIRDLELGKNRKTKAPIKPSPDVLRALAKAYNIEYDELMRLAGYSDNNQENIYIEETEMERLKREIVDIVGKARNEEDIKSMLHIVKKALKE